MSDLVPIAIFLGCLLATIGLVHVCERLRITAVRGKHDRRSAEPVERKP